MATYFTKCGREFKKSSKSVVTGYRMAEEDAECLVCPHRVDVKEGWPEQVRKCFECRAGSEPPNYTTEPQSVAIGTANTLHIYTMDLSLIDRIRGYIQSDHTEAAG